VAAPVCSPALAAPTDWPGHDLRLEY